MRNAAEILEQSRREFWPAEFSEIWLRHTAPSSSNVLLIWAIYWRIYWGNAEKVGRIEGFGENILVIDYDEL